MVDGLSFTLGGWELNVRFSGLRNTQLNKVVRESVKPFRRRLTTNTATRELQEHKIKNHSCVSLNTPHWFKAPIAYLPKFLMIKYHHLLRSRQHNRYTQNTICTHIVKSIPLDTPWRLLSKTWVTSNPLFYCWVKDCSGLEVHVIM